MSTQPTKPANRPPSSPDGAADSQVHIRVTRRRKAAWVNAAHPGKLSEWVQSNLDKAAGFKEGE